MPNHGLFLGEPTPSVTVLNEWLTAQELVIHDAVEITEMEDGAGWRLLCNRDLDIGEVCES
jgi:hypothetical protein